MDKKITQPLVTKKITHLPGTKKYATSWDKNLLLPLGTKKITQMAPNYSKWFQMTMAKANGYGNGLALSQIVPNGLKCSEDLGLRIKD